MDASELRLALRRIAQVLDAGERSHPPDSDRHWLKVPAREHVRRSLTHAERFLVRARSNEDDLVHAAARILLGLEVREREREAREQVQSAFNGRRV